MAKLKTKENFLLDKKFKKVLSKQIKSFVGLLDNKIGNEDFKKMKKEHHKKYFQ